MDDAFPGGWPAFNPALGVKDAPAAMAWYARVLGADEIFRLAAPDGTIIHAEMKVAGGLLMLGEAAPERGSADPTAVGGTPVRLHLMVDDVDTVFEAALDAGAEVVFPLEDRFYGHRSGRIRDPFGHEWILATLTEEMTLEEMQRRMDALYEEGD